MAEAEHYEGLRQRHVADFEALLPGPVERLAWSAEDLGRERLRAPRRVPRGRVGRFKRPPGRLCVRLGRLGDLLRLSRPVPAARLGIRPCPRRHPHGRRGRGGLEADAHLVGVRADILLCGLCPAPLPGQPSPGLDRCRTERTAALHPHGLQLVPSPADRRGRRREAADRTASGHRHLRAATPRSEGRPGGDVGNARCQQLRDVGGRVRGHLSSRRHAPP